MVSRIGTRSSGKERLCGGALTLIVVVAGLH